MTDLGITYEEANLPEPYCKRCGKKLGTEAHDVHTCTPIKKGISLRDAVANLIKVKGRHNTEIAYQKLIEAFDAPEKEWVGLTDEEIAEGIINSWVIGQAFESVVWWAEEKLKEKNCD